MSFLDNPLHIAYVLIALLLVFGAKRVPEIGRSLGSGLREFKRSVSGEGEEADAKAGGPPQVQPALAQPAVVAPVVSAPPAQPVAQPAVVAPAAAPEPAQAVAQPADQQPQPVGQPTG